ncbi:MAG TPA: DNA primase [Verrucomicrobiae bacterium]|nr:DNA primase [Verrucomicrobiae bacterium]
MAPFGRAGAGAAEKGGGALKVSADKLQEVRERAGILEVVGDYVALKRSGANYQGLCPFHTEKSPSFNVNPGRGIFHCFGCGAGGDVFAFVMRTEGMNFHEALRFLAKRVGVVIEEAPLSPQEKRRADERDLLYRVSDLAAGFYRNLLLRDAAGAAARGYLEKRGVDPSTAETYRLGFAPDRWDALVRHLQERRVPLEVAEKVGLVRRRDSGGYFDTFRNRLLFVIADSQGRPVGFGGRVLDDSLPKYLNSPESPVYRKSEVLFGVDLAKQAMRETGYALVVEGYFDHLALHRAGVRNVVATCGTALTPGHVALLRRYVQKVYTLFDSDAAGIKATLRSVELFLEEKVPAYVVELPAGEDPDSFIASSGGEAFGEAVKRAKPAFEYVIRSVLKETSTGSVDGKVQAVEKLAPLLVKVANPIERENYLLEIARLLEIDARQLRQRVGGGGLELRQPAQQKEKRGDDPQETLLLLMVKYPEIIGRVQECGMESLFAEGLVPLAQEVLASAGEPSAAVIPRVLDRCCCPEERNRLAALFLNDSHLDDLDLDAAFRVLDDCREKRERGSVREQEKELRRELTRLDPDSERYWEVLRALDVLRGRKSRLS